MNKYLMLSAAAVMASSAANAGTFLHSFQFGTAGGGTYCDGGSVYSSGTSIWSWRHTNNNCAGGQSEGQGLVGFLVSGKNPTIKGANMSDTFYGQNYGVFSVYLSYTLPKKLATGKPWELWVGFSGTTSFLGNSGALLNVAAGHKGHTSTASKVMSLIKAHKG